MQSSEVEIFKSRPEVWLKDVIKSFFMKTHTLKFLVSNESFQVHREVAKERAHHDQYTNNVAFKRL